MFDIIYLIKILVVYLLFEIFRCIDIVFWFDFFNIYSDFKDFIFKNM